MYIFICIICCVVSVLICVVVASAAVLHPAATTNHIVHKLSFASHFTYLTQYAAPHRSMDVGGAPSLSLKCGILASYANLRIQFSIHILRGRLYTHGSKVSVFISYLL